MVGAVSGVAAFLPTDNKLIQLGAGAGLVLSGFGAIVALFRYRWAAVVWVVAIVVAAGGGVFAGYLLWHKDKDPAPPVPTPSVSSALPPTAEAKIVVTFNSPTPSQKVDRGKALEMDGTVTGLPPGKHLYIVSRGYASDDPFYVVGGAPASVDQSGGWTAKDGGVGSLTDSPGTRRRFIPVVPADDKCDATLAATKNTDSHGVDAADWPSSCTQLGPAAVVVLQ